MSILNGRINYIKSYYDIILNNINLKGLFFYLDCAQVFIILYFLHWEETLDSLFVLIQKKKKNNELNTQVSLFILNQEWMCIK